MKVFDVSEIKLEPLNEDTKEKNNQKIKEYFSKEKMIATQELLYGTRRK